MEDPADWGNESSEEASGNLQNPGVLFITNSKAILDTGASLNYIPTKDYKGFVDLVSAKQNCVKTSLTTNTDMLLCDCVKKGDTYEGFPTLEFSLGGHALSLRPQFYLKWNKENEKC